MLRLSPGIGHSCMTLFLSEWGFGRQGTVTPTLYLSVSLLSGLWSAPRVPVHSSSPAACDVFPQWNPRVFNPVLILPHCPRGQDFYVELRPLFLAMVLFGFFFLKDRFLLNKIQLSFLGFREGSYFSTVTDKHIYLLVPKPCLSLEAPGWSESMSWQD